MLAAIVITHLLMNNACKEDFMSTKANERCAKAQGNLVCLDSKEARVEFVSERLISQ